MFGNKKKDGDDYLTGHFKKDEQKKKKKSRRSNEEADNDEQARHYRQVKRSQKDLEKLLLKADKDDLSEWLLLSCSFIITVVPALGDSRRERPPAVCGHFVNVPTHFKVKLPVISGHLPNTDADSHLLVVSTCHNGQCKQMPRFRWSFQPKIAGAHLNLRPTDLSNVRAVVW